jgi:3-methyladenine DNA glycosylase/8-oxoguanine DNA glycosylase
MSDNLILRHKNVIELVPSAPYHFDATLHKPDHFPSGDNEWEPGICWQTMLWKNIPLGLKFENHGSVDKPCIQLSVFSHSELEHDYLAELVAEIEFRNDLHMDLQAFNRRFKDHPILGSTIARWYGMRLMNQSSLYEYLIIAIVLQNATVRRSVNMMQALFENYGTMLTYDGKDLYCFWKPESIEGVPEEELRSLKVGYRAKFIKRITETFQRKEIDEFTLRQRSREEQRQTLLQLYGVGPASVEYILSDVFHHLDEINHISPWEQKIYSKLFFDTNPEEPVSVEKLRAYFDEQFAGYQMLAVHYFWEDLFWKRKTENIPWLERLIRL